MITITQRHYMILQRSATSAEAFTFTFTHSRMQTAAEHSQAQQCAQCVLTGGAHMSPTRVYESPRSAKCVRLKRVPAATRCFMSAGRSVLYT
jgi:hypothetical protein